MPLGIGDPRIDPAENVIKNAVAEGGDQNTDNIGPGRGQGAGIWIRNIVELRDGIIDAVSQLFRDLGRFPQGSGDGNGADTSQSGDI